MIPYLNSRWAKCKGTCEKSFEYDFTLYKRTPIMCPGCKKAALAARVKKRRAAVKQVTAAVDVKSLERLAVRSYDEVGALMGISSETVRKTEQAALAKLGKKFAALRPLVQAHLRPETRAVAVRTAVRGGE